MIPPRKIQLNRGLIPGRRRPILRGLKGVWTRVQRPLLFTQNMLIPWLRAYIALRQLDHQLGPRKGRAKGCVIVAVHYGTDQALAHFLRHHRQLGVRDFVFLDLSVDGRLAEHLSGEEGCAIWRPRDLQAHKHATSWLNALRRIYATGRWCLSLDTTDVFVFHRCEQRKLADFTDFLESESRDHVYAVTVDMYGEQPADELDVRGSAPLDVLNHFDRFGYATGSGRHRTATVRGGPQRRLLYRGRPNQSPALNRIPLVKWHWYYGYLAGTHLIMPGHLNTPHAHWHSSPTACILSLAFLNDKTTLEYAAAWETRSQHRDALLASSYLGLSRLVDVPLKRELSQRYAMSSDLVDCGLLNPGQWF